MKNPDLHLHTWYSDGKEAPAVVVRRARDAGIDLLAITDHDGMEGVEEAVAEGKRLGVPVLRGCEFSAEYEASLPGFEGDTHYMHILGYGMDPSNAALKEALERIGLQRAQRNEQLRLVFAELGYPMRMEDLQVHTVNNFVGKVSFAKVLVSMGACRDVDEAFRSERLLAHPKIKAIKRSKIEAREAIRLINGAGGRAFFAHPFQLSFKPRKEETEETYRLRQQTVIASLKEHGLCGIECWYPTHSPEQTDFLLGLASRMGMLVSRGSDDHGENVRADKRMGNYQTQVDLSLLKWTEEYL